MEFIFKTYKTNPVLYAVQARNKKMIELLVKYGGSLNRQIETTSRTVHFSFRIEMDVKFIFRFMKCVQLLHLLLPFQQET